MLAYLIKNPYSYSKAMSEHTSKIFIDKRQAEFYFESVLSRLSKQGLMLKPSIDSFELVTDEFMQQTIQPKEQHEINTNSSL